MIMLFSPLLLSLPLSLSTLHFNAGRGYEPFAHATPEGVLISNTTPSPLTDSIILTEPAASATISFRVKNRHAHPSHTYPYLLPSGKEKRVKCPAWTVFIGDSAGHRLRLTLSTKEAEGPLSSEPYTSVMTSFEGTTGFEPVYQPSEVLIESGKLPFHGETLWTVTAASGELSVVAGSHEPIRVLSYPNQLSEISTFGFSAAPGGEILISDISFISDGPPAEIYDPATLPAILSESNDPIEGYWQIFDRSLEESLLRLGGDYKLAVVKDHDRYAIIYLDGARVNAAQWKPGMVKGWLTPNVFPGLYTLEWLDAEGKPLSNSVSAQLTDEGVLTIQFPYQSSEIRLRRH